MRLGARAPTRAFNFAVCTTTAHGLAFAVLQLGIRGAAPLVPRPLLLASSEKKSSPAGQDLCKSTANTNIAPRLASGLQVSGSASVGSVYLFTLGALGWRLSLLAGISIRMLCSLCSGYCRTVAAEKDLAWTATTVSEKA